MALRLKTESQAILLRDLSVAAAVRDRLVGTNANAVEAGEFAAQTASTTAVEDEATLGAITGDVVAAFGGGTFPSNEGLLYQVFTERGRYDVQAIDKLTVLWGYPYEAETNVYDSTGSITIGQPLTVKVGTQTGTTARLVLAKPTAAGQFVYAFALNAVAATSLPLGRTFLRFKFVGPSYLTA